jgi:uncharacterized protein YdhG (YjbR/CyaY superfamily)
MKNKTSRRSPTTIDEYLACVDVDKRKALQKLRKDIRAVAPKLEECMTYGIAGFRLNGKFLVGLGAGAEHCAFYPGSTLKQFQKELKGYELGKGTIRFPAAAPLPTRLVQKVVRRRIAQNAALKEKAAAKPARKRAT